jgi:hypothetical protein
MNSIENDGKQYPVQILTDRQPGIIQNVIEEEIVDGATDILTFFSISSAVVDRL